MDNANGIGFFILITIGYFAPTILAPRGRRGSVFALNLFLGWTLICWVIALVMALRAKEEAAAAARGKAGA